MPDLSPEALSPFLRVSGLVFADITRTEVTGSVAAGPDHHTPWGVVHGGLYATAVESATSVGASLAVADEGMFAVGLTNQTEFIRAHTQGRLIVKAWPIHQGRTGQLWQCDITREDGKLVAQGRVASRTCPCRPPTPDSAHSAWRPRVPPEELAVLLSHGHAIAVIGRPPGASTGPSRGSTDWMRCLGPERRRRIAARRR